jgi:DNA repair protein RadD
LTVATERRYGFSVIQLRHHQLEAVNRLAVASDGRFAHAEICVAGGKSLIMGALAGRAHAASRSRALILAHTSELVKQNIEACSQLGIFAAPCAREVGVNLFAPITVGTIQTVVRRLDHFRDVRLVIPDETHMVSPDEKSMYRRLFEALPEALIRGVSGTAFRADGSGSLEESFGPCVFRYSFADALADGHVKPLRQVDAEADDIDIQGVKVARSGEWDSHETAHRGIALAPVHAKAAWKALQEEGRRRTLVFACDIEHADVLAREFNAAAGRRVAAAVHSGLDASDQERLIGEFRDGRLPVMVSVQKFTVGFNVPEVDSLVLCRPIRSRVYYVQALGRGARKTHVALDCIVIDFGGNVGRHGALDMIKPVEVRPPKTEREREELRKSAFKTCKACGHEYAEFFTSCPHCGHDPRLDRSVGSDLSMRSKARELLEQVKLQPQWVDVAGPAVRIPGKHWKIPVEGAQAIWWPAHLPAPPVRVYARWDARWGFVAEGLYDVEGIIHQP